MRRHGGPEHWENAQTKQSLIGMRLGKPVERKDDAMIVNSEPVTCVYDVLDDPAHMRENNLSRRVFRNDIEYPLPRLTDRVSERSLGDARWVYGFQIWQGTGAVHKDARLIDVHSRRQNLLNAYVSVWVSGCQRHGSKSADLGV
jgi:hypothetical protein